MNHHKVAFIALLVVLCAVVVVGMLPGQPSLDHGQSGFILWERATNPPENSFRITSQTIKELGYPVCIEHVTVTGTLLDGGRNSQGEERTVARTFRIPLAEQRNGLLSHSVDLGRGHLIALKVQGFLPSDDGVCMAQAKGELK